MAESGVFVTGTDTGIGKTLFCCALLSALADRGLSVSGYKPVAAGARLTEGGLRNDDAEHLMDHATVTASYETVNPLALEPAIAPHIALWKTGSVFDLDRIMAAYRHLADRSDVIVVEGAGGWLVPLAQGFDMATLSARLALPVIMVVGMKLGCLNHALLTAEAIRNRGLQIAGWVANCFDPDMQALEENLATLEQRIGLPAIAVIPRCEGVDERAKAGLAASCLDPGQLDRLFPIA